MTTANTIKEILDQKRDELLKQMEEEVMGSKEVVEESEEDVNIEDFSIEEIEAFMVSEEYEQLDEVSKELLGRYMKKAKDSSEEHSAKSRLASHQANTARDHGRDDDAKRHDSEAKSARSTEQKRNRGIRLAAHKMSK